MQNSSNPASLIWNCHWVTVVYHCWNHICYYGNKSLVSDSDQLIYTLETLTWIHFKSWRDVTQFDTCYTNTLLDRPWKHSVTVTYNHLKRRIILIYFYHFIYNQWNNHCNNNCDLWDMWNNYLYIYNNYLWCVILCYYFLK